MAENYDSQRLRRVRRTAEEANTLAGELGLLIGVICGVIGGIILVVANAQTCGYAGWMLPEGNISLLWAFYGAFFGGVVGGGLGTIIGLMRCCTGAGCIMGASGGLIAAQMLTLFNLSCAGATYTGFLLPLLGSSLMGLIIGLTNKYLLQINQPEAIN
jgi:hypothetical protein